MKKKTGLKNPNLSKTLISPPARPCRLCQHTYTASRLYDSLHPGDVDHASEAAKWLSYLNSTAVRAKGRKEILQTPGVAAAYCDRRSVCKEH